MKSDLFLTRAIPSSLRDTGHPDKELVLMAITYALTAFKDANTMTATDATIAKHVHDALVTFEEKVFKPHLSKEDEDWNKLKELASRAMPVVKVLSVSDVDSESTSHFTLSTASVEYEDHRFEPSFRRMAQCQRVTSEDPSYGDDTWRCSVKTPDGAQYKGSGQSPEEAFKLAVVASGAMVQ